MIEVKNLVKKYGNHLAVDHLDFQIKPGMVYGFLGPNGAGKSTTMNIMTGCMGATQGEVLINGYDILKDQELPFFFFFCLFCPFRAAPMAYGGSLGV